MQIYSLKIVTIIIFQWSLAQWEYFGLWPQWENYDNDEYFDDGDDDYVDDDRDVGLVFSDHSVKILPAGDGRETMECLPSSPS